MAPTKHVPIAQEIMTRKLVTIPPDRPIFAAMRVLLRNRISGAPVVDSDGSLVGILSELDCLKVLANGEFYDDDHSEEGTVQNYMTAVTQSVGPDVDVYTLAQYFLDHSVRRIPVVGDGQLLGQISRRDVLRTIEEMGKSRATRNRATAYREPAAGLKRPSHQHKQ